MHLPDLTSLLWVQLTSSSLLKSNALARALSSHQQSFYSRSTLAFLLQMSWDFHPNSLTTAFCLEQLLVLGKRISTSSAAHLLSYGLFPFSSTGVYPSQTFVTPQQLLSFLQESHCEVPSDTSSCRLGKSRTSHSPRGSCSLSSGCKQRHFCVHSRINQR